MIDFKKVLCEVGNRIYIAEPNSQIGVWEIGEIVPTHIKTISVSSIFELLHELSKANEIDWSWAKNRIRELI